MYIHTNASMHQYVYIYMYIYIYIYVHTRANLCMLHVLCMSCVVRADRPMEPQLPRSVEYREPQYRRPASASALRPTVRQRRINGVRSMFVASVCRPTYVTNATS